MLKQVFSYIAIGIINTTVTVSIFVFLARSNFHYVIYTVAGYLAGFVSSYWLNSIFTFCVPRPRRASLAGFVALNASLLVVGQVVQAALIDGLRWPESAGVTVGMAVFTTLGFIVNRRFFVADRKSEGRFCEERRSAGSWTP